MACTEDSLRPFCVSKNFAEMGMAIEELLKRFGNTELVAKYESRFESFVEKQENRDVKGEATGYQDGMGGRMVAGQRVGDKDLGRTR